MEQNAAAAAIARRYIEKNFGKIPRSI